MILLVLMLFSYLLGGLCVGYYLVRWRTGKDLRTLGSGTLGARNAGRVLGRWAFVAALVGDMAKGSVVVGLARWVAPEVAWAAPGALAAAILGHTKPVQLGFRGGKGAATGLGGLLVLDPVLPFVLIAVMAAAWACMRATKPAGLVAIVAATPAACVLGRGRIEVAGIGLLTAMVLAAHARDIGRYLSGRGARRPDATAAHAAGGAEG